jgi:hypothetical protein
MSTVLKKKIMIKKDSFRERLIEFLFVSLQKTRSSQESSCLRFIIFDHPDELSSSRHSHFLCNKFFVVRRSGCSGILYIAGEIGHGGSALSITATKWPVWRVKRGQQCGYAMKFDSAIRSRTRR